MSDFYSLSDMKMQAVTAIANGRYRRAIVCCEHMKKASETGGAPAAAEAVLAAQTAVEVHGGKLVLIGVDTEWGRMVGQRDDFYIGGVLVKTEAGLAASEQQARKEGYAEGVCALIDALKAKGYLSCTVKVALAEATALFVGRPK